MWFSEGQNSSKNGFTCPYTTLGFLPGIKRSVIGLFGRVMNNNELCSDWLFHSAALLWLAVSQCGSMLSSALIGCFTVRLCSDWLFHSAALLWLAVSQCGSMLSSALIGCFTVRLCSDWLFHSEVHFSWSHSRKETQGKYIFQFFLTLLYNWVIILYIKCGH